MILSDAGALTFNTLRLRLTSLQRIYGRYVIDFCDTGAAAGDRFVPRSCELMKLMRSMGFCILAKSLASSVPRTSKSFLSLPRIAQFFWRRHSGRDRFLFLTNRQPYQ